MKKPTRIGIVTVRELGGKRWTLRYRDPATGSDTRRRLTGLDASEVNRIASHVSQEVLADKGYIPGRNKSLPTLKEAFAETIRLSGQRPYIRRDSGNRANLFIKWLDEHYPRRTEWEKMAWGKLKPSMVQHYARDLEKKGRALYTIRNHLRPVKAAWRYMVENYQGEVSPLPRIRVTVKPKKAIDCLNPVEVATLLKWLRSNDLELYPMGVLASLAGLRMLEAAALRRQDIDFENGTVEITDTGEHVPKTASSYRVIPVCSEVLEALRIHLDGMKVIPTTGELFRNQVGRVWSADGISQKWRRALKKAAQEVEVDRLATVPPHRLRSSFATMVKELGVDRGILKRYVGHSQEDILGEHYLKIEVDGLRSVSGKIETWRLLLCAVKSGNNVATPEN